MTTDPTTRKRRDTIAIWAEGATASGDIVMGDTTKPNGMPWVLDRDDLAHFREATRDHVLVMGRTTFEKLPANLKSPESTFERPLIVLTTTIPLLDIDIAGYWHAGTFETPQDVVNFARAIYPEKGVAFIGGPTVIEWAEPVIERIFLTEVKGVHHGDTPAPENKFLEQFEFRKSLGNTGTLAMAEYDRGDNNPESKELLAA